MLTVYQILFQVWRTEQPKKKKEVGFSVFFFSSGSDFQVRKITYFPNLWFGKLDYCCIPETGNSSLLQKKKKICSALDILSLKSVSNLTWITQPTGYKEKTAHTFYTFYLSGMHRNVISETKHFDFQKVMTMRGHRQLMRKVRKLAKNDLRPHTWVRAKIKLIEG